jgi:hypothetical protein
MIIKRTSAIVLPQLLLFLVLLGCTFEPQEDFFKEVKQVVPSPIIDLTDYNEEDTIVMLQPTKFKYMVAINEPSALQEVQILLDSSAILSTPFLSGEFTLSQSSIPVGIHKLTIQFIAKSNSGSLADKAGAEYFQVWKTWIVKVERFDNDPPDTPEVRISEEDGFLRLDWTPYSKTNFVGYRLRVLAPYPREIQFKNQLSTYWVDSSFLWGSAGYELTVTNTYGSNTTTVGLTEAQKLTLIYNKEDSTAVVKWKPSRFYRAFGRAVIKENETVRHTTANGSDSTLTLKLNEVLWGRGESVTLQIFPKNSQLTTFESREFLYDHLPVKRLFSRPTLYYQDGIKQVVGFSRSAALFYFFDDQLEVTDSVAVYTSAVSVPYSGNYAYYVNNNAVVRWNLSTNEKVYTNDNANFAIEPLSISGSSNGIVSYYSMNNQYPWDVRLSLVIQNTDDKTFIQKTNVNYDPKITLPPKNFVLSDDGGLCLTPYSLVISRVESGLPNIGALPSPGYFLCFRHDNNNEILMTGSESVNIVSSNDLSIIRTITLPSGYKAVSYDPVTHYVVCTKTDSEVLYLVNIDNNHTKPFKAISPEWSLVNGYLINYAGQYMKVL